MNKHICGKMALTNITKNGKIYLPYLLTVISSITFYFLLSSIGSNPNIYNLETGAEAFSGASTLCVVLQSGSFVTSVFISIFLLYANSFVLKHQKRQFGLYRVLGIERKHIAKIVFTEVICIFGAGLLAALLLGILFDKLTLVGVFKIIGQPVPAGFSLNIGALVDTLILAASVAGVILVFNIISILTTKDIELLKSEKAGEKEPKSKPIYACTGVIALAIGYCMAQKKGSAGDAISNFFPAALLVMYATYALFAAGSIFVLKLLKKNKKFYYQTRHFISVSGMLYRMKQNAAGLATICILSTATIIVLSAGISLWMNGERSINEQFPREVQIWADTTDGSGIEELLQEESEACGFELENGARCTFSSTMVMKTEDGIAPMEAAQFASFEGTIDTYIMTLEEYNRFNKTAETLTDTELLLYASDGSYSGDTMVYQGTVYSIKGVADESSLDLIRNYSMSLFSRYLIVVPNEEVLGQFLVEGRNATGTWFGFDCKQDVAEVSGFMQGLSERFEQAGIPVEYMLKQQEQDMFYCTYGGIMFVGAILGVMFLLCTAMIIYYKQISEGYEDRERFLVMQKVGLSKGEIKKVIHSQIMLVFFLPVVTAVLHAVVASGIVARCLSMVLVVHMPTFATAVALTCVVFLAVYAIVYRITSKEYYGIVNG